MIEIRHAQPEDIFSVIKIAYETLPERYNPVIFNQFYESFPEGFLIAEQHHKKVGFIIGVKTEKNIARILMLSIIKDQRRQGIGSALLTHFLQAMIPKNIEKVELEVRTNNISATKFYKKHRFQIIETIPKFYQNGDDAYIMQRILRSQ